jgi:hypothetical protein
VLLPLLRARAAGLGDARIDEAVDLAVEKSWQKLFHPRQGVGYARPGREGKMRPELAAEFALSFALSAADHRSSIESGLEWAGMVLRHLVMSQRGADGEIALVHEGRLLSAASAQRAADAVRSAVRALGFDVADPTRDESP